MVRDDEVVFWKWDVERKEEGGRLRLCRKKPR